jgi:YD repeat-containing protein
VGQVLTTTDPLGIVTQFGYDSLGNQTSIIRDIGPGRLNQLTTISYNAVGDPISITDPRANITTSTYDAARRLTTTTAPNGLVTAYNYDPDGHVVQAQQSASGTVLRSTGATYTLTGKLATRSILDERMTIIDTDQITGAALNETIGASQQPLLIFINKGASNFINDHTLMHLIEVKGSRLPARCVILATTGVCGGETDACDGAVGPAGASPDARAGRP